MRQLTLTEGSPAETYDLTTKEAEAIAGAELGEVARLPGASDWSISAGRKIGVARIGDLQLTVRPKIPIDRLIFLMSYARDPKFWRDQSVLLGVDSDITEALAHAFGFHASKALDQGLLQGYRRTDDSLSVVRGRIRVGDQISRHYGRGLPLEITYDDFTVDVAENQVLLTAALLLLRMPGVRPTSRDILQRLRLKLAGVSPVPRGQRTPGWVASRLNTRYQPALRLADLILAGNSFEQNVGDIQVTGFIVDMWKAYEDFVCVALREALRAHGGRVALQSKLHLDEGEQVELRPDFLWTAPYHQQVVADAKYKAEKPSGFPQADLYQLLAYCTVLRIPIGHLIYAKGNEKPASHVVRNAGVVIRCHTLDLEQSPRQVLGQIAAIATELVRGRPKWPSEGTAGTLAFTGDG